jgi:Predicted metal-binding integral membrane protein (DUF2182)
MIISGFPLPNRILRPLLWRCPEFWVLVLSAAAWMFFVVDAFWYRPLAEANSHMWMGHMYHTVPPSGILHALYGAVSAVILHWPMMIAAMMFPLLVGQLRVVAARSLWARRNRAMAFFLLGYTFPWLLYGLTVEACRQTHALSSFSPLLPLCFLLTAAWQLSPLKRRSLVGCHLTMPLAPSGWRSDFDCCRYGIRIAMSCWLSCWVLMLTCVAAHHALWAMLVVTGVAWLERLLRQPRQLWIATALVGVALCAAGLRLSGGG